MKAKYSAVWLTAMLAALPSACSSVPTAPPVVAECYAPVDPQRPGPALVGQRYGMAMSALPLNSVQFADNALARAMAIQSVHATRTPTNAVRIHARFVSCSDQAAAVRMRTSFMRADTAPSESPSAWKYVFLPARATAVYEETSISGDAATYLIEVQP